MEELRSVVLKAEIDTNKATYEGRFGSLSDLVDWWNDHADILGGQTYTLVNDDDSRGDAFDRDTR